MNPREHSCNRAIAQYHRVLRDCTKQSTLSHDWWWSIPMGNPASTSRVQRVDGNSRYSSNHIPTNPHPLYPSGYQPSKLPHAKWKSEIPAPQQYTIARITPLSFAHSVRKCGGYIPLPPLLYTHTRSETHAKETPSVRCAETTLAKHSIPPSPQRGI